MPENPRSSTTRLAQLLVGIIVLAFAIWLQGTLGGKLSDFLAVLPPGSDHVFHFLKAFFVVALPWMKTLLVLIALYWFLRRTVFLP